MATPPAPPNKPISEPPSHDPDPHELETGDAAQTGRHSAFGLVTGIIVVLILIAFGVYFLVHKNGTTMTFNPSSGPNLSADQIRQQFQTSTSSVAGAYTGKAPSNNNPSIPAPTSNSAATVTPRGGAPLYSNPSYAPPPKTVRSAPTRPATQIYQNSQYGFSFIMPGNWTANNLNTNTIIFFDQNTGQQVGYIEIYANDSDESLNDLSSSLQNSPDVTQISYTTLAGQDALIFKSTGQYQTGIAAIFNNNIYYIRGDLTKPDIAGSFKFN